MSYASRLSFFASKQLVGVHTSLSGWGLNTTMLFVTPQRTRAFQGTVRVNARGTIRALCGQNFVLQNLENPPFCKAPKQAYRTQLPLGPFTLTVPPPGLPFPADAGQHHRWHIASAFDGEATDRARCNLRALGSAALLTDYSCRLADPDGPRTSEFASGEKAVFAERWRPQMALPKYGIEPKSAALRRKPRKGKASYYNKLTAWRSGRDSNPRYGFAVYSLSRRAPSTTRPPLRMICDAWCRAL